MSGGHAVMKVLVVDEHHHRAATLVSFLASRGHHAYVFKTGEAALRRAPDLKPDVMLIDAALPTPSGVSLARQIRLIPALAATRLIALNENGEAVNRDAAVEQGYDDLLNPPYTPEDVLDVITRVRSRVSATQERILLSKQVAEQTGARVSVARQELDAWWFERRDAPRCVVSFLGCEESLINDVRVTLAAPGVQLERLAANAPAAVDGEPGDCYHCLVADADAGEFNAHALLEELSLRQPALPIIFLVSAGDIAGAVRLMRAGACDVVERPGGAELAEAIQIALYGLYWYAARPPDIGDLTVQERRLLELTVKGLLNKQIAREMNISLRTVHLRRTALMSKLGAASRIELIRRAVELRLARL
ncbi:MAG TPA: response regulator [Pirellulales bacterium]